MEKDSRRHRRKVSSLRIDYADTHGRAGIGLVKNISPHGVFVEYVQGLLIGEKLRITFVLPTGQPWKSEAEVVHVTPQGCGLKFVALPPWNEDIQILEKYCAE